MVSQLHWEDDVIWNGADVKPEVRTILKMVIESSILHLRYIKDSHIL